LQLAGNRDIDASAIRYGVRLILPISLLEVIPSTTKAARLSAAVKNCQSHGRLSRYRIGSCVTILLVALSGAWQLHAQHYSFQSYSEDNGLGNLSIQCLLQDHIGYIWVGTQNGIYRYEGQHFVAFGRKQGLSDTMISALHETVDGTLWVGTRSGLYRFEAGRFRSVPRTVAYEIRWQFGLASDRKDRLFVATDRGLLIGDPPFTSAGARNFHFYTDPQLPEGQPVSSVYVDPNDTVWFSYSTKLCKLYAGALNIIGNEEGLPDQSWKAILSDGNGDLWLRSPQHLFVWDHKRRHFIPRETGMASGESRSYLALDGSRQILIPTDHGLGHWNGTRWEFLTQANGLPGDSVCCVLNDGEGSRWIGMRGTGLARSRTLMQWESWGHAEGLRSEDIWAMQRDSRGKLWVGTSAGLERLPLKRTRQGGEISSASGSRSVISSFARDSGGILWAGSAAGRVLRINVDTGVVRQFGAESGLTGTNMLSVLSLMLDSSNHLWVSTNEGLFKADATVDSIRFALQSVPSSVSREMFHQCIQDKVGAFWAAGRKGLVRFQDGKWTRFSVPDGLRGKHVTGVAVQANGDLWISYGGEPGVSHLWLDAANRRHIEHFSRADRLHSDQIVTLGVDQRDWVWIGGENGIDVFQGGRWQYFGRAQGLVWNDCNSNAFYADRDGSVWIGTSRGLAHFRPQSAPLPNPPPPVLLTSARWGTRSVIDERPPSFAYANHPLVISFTGLTYDNESAVRFRYRLGGLEPEWVETDAREVRFASLHPGQYTFEVQARSAEHVWSREPARLQLTIRPPWWQTWWFRLFQLAAILLTIRLLWVWRTGQLVKRQRELERAVADRTQELEAERKKFQELATWDSLTGVWNRRAIFEVLSNELARAKRSGDTVAVVMADLDRFKQINDQHGHQAGDAVLQEAARRMKTAIRVSDGLGRYGGEEFLIILPGCDSLVASRRAEEIRELIARDPVATNVGELHVTCSLGVNWTRKDFYDASWLIKAADAALYRAKHGGRNRVEIASSEQIEVPEEVVSLK
jgi:diguanylate cyclase (GGDEF)-like protein